MGRRTGPSSSTAEDVLWPLVAAGVAGARIQLYAANTHLLRIAEQGCSDWDSSHYGAAAIKQGIDRLVGFGSARSDVLAVPMVVHWKAQTSADAISQGLRTASFVCEGCDAEDEFIIGNIMQKAYYPSLQYQPSEQEQEQEQDQHFKENLIEESSSKVFVKMNYTNFDVGVDGECCFQQLGVTDLDSTCILRPFRYVELRPVVRRGDALQTCSPTQSTAVKFTVSLRGNFYSDIILSKQLTVQVPAVTNAHMYGMRTDALLDEILFYRMNVYGLC